VRGFKPRHSPLLCGTAPPPFFLSDSSRSLKSGTTLSSGAGPQRNRCLVQLLVCSPCDRRPQSNATQEWAYADHPGGDVEGEGETLAQECTDLASRKKKYLSGKPEIRIVFTCKLITQEEQKHTPTHPHTPPSSDPAMQAHHGHVTMTKLLISRGCNSCLLSRVTSEDPFFVPRPQSRLPNQDTNS
jgi:hypothetical protein